MLGLGSGSVTEGDEARRGTPKRPSAVKVYLCSFI